MNQAVAVEVTRTVRPYAEMVEKLFKTMGTPEASLMHATIGIAGECGELVLATAMYDRANILEELGDLRFYMQQVFDTFGWSLYTFNEYRADDSLLDLSNFDDMSAVLHIAISAQVIAADIVDVAKKSWVYNKPLDEAALFDHMGKLCALYEAARNNWSYDEQDVQDANRGKLAKRYPEGVYSDADAQARADKAESPNLPAEAPWPANPAIEGNPPFIVTGNGA